MQFFMDFAVSPKLNTRQKRHRDSNKASAHPAGRKRWLGARSTARVC